MANNDIPPPRVDFAIETTDSTGKKRYVVSREWYYYLRQLKLTDEEITLISITNEGNTIGAIAETTELSKSTRDAYLLGFRPDHRDAALGEANKRSNENRFLAFLPQRNLHAQIAELRKKLHDVEMLAWHPRMGSTTSGTGTGSFTLDCDTLEPIGYWSPVTDGASNIIYSGGQVVVAFTCTE